MSKGNELLEAVLIKEPVKFQSILETILKEKVTALVSDLKADMSTKLFAESADAPSSEEDEEDDKDSEGA